MIAWIHSKQVYDPLDKSYCFGRWVILACCHFICLVCLLNDRKGKDKAKKYKCPQCREFNSIVYYGSFDYEQIKLKEE